MQILQFSPIMRSWSCFTTSLPGALPFINTALCECVCMCTCGRAIIFNLPLLNIHSFSLNKQINQCQRGNTFIPLHLLVFSTACLLAQGLHGAGRKKGTLLPVHVLQHHQHLSHGATSLGNPNMDRADTQPTDPCSPYQLPVEVAPAAAGHRASSDSPLQCLTGCPSFLPTPLGAGSSAQAVWR